MVCSKFLFTFSFCMKHFNISFYASFVFLWDFISDVFLCFILFIIICFSFFLFLFCLVTFLGVFSYTTFTMVALVSITAVNIFWLLICLSDSLHIKTFPCSFDIWRLFGSGCVHKRDRFYIMELLLCFNMFYCYCISNTSRLVVLCLSIFFYLSYLMFCNL